MAHGRGGDKKDGRLDVLHVLENAAVQAKEDGHGFAIVRVDVEAGGVCMDAMASSPLDCTVGGTMAAKKSVGPKAPGPDSSARLARLAADALKDPKASAREKSLAGGVLSNTRAGTVPPQPPKPATKSASKGKK